MESDEVTEEEKRIILDGRDFANKLSKELDGKRVGDVLPLDIAAVTFGCLSRLFESNPLAGTVMKQELMNVGTLIAACVLKFQEHKIEEAQALEKLWKED